jgi:L-methionine (R)-S-oxide reductase
LPVILLFLASFQTHLTTFQFFTKKLTSHTGFYVLDPSITSSSQKPKQLILAPFQGPVACQTIAFNRGVCGTVAAKGETIIVPDVEKFPGHIACDGGTRSEIVVPIFRSGGSAVGDEAKDGRKAKGEIVGVIDIDCLVEGAFDEVDAVWLERLAVLLGGACEW